MFSLVLAIDKNRGMGLDGGLAWRLKKDMAFFKAITTSNDLFETETNFGIVRDSSQPIHDLGKSSGENAVIMGRKTWDSIPEKFRPLAGRNNIILSRTGKETSPGTRLFSSLEESLTAPGSENSHVFIIGGNNVYSQCLRHPDLARIYLTQIYHEYNCDIFFEELPARFELSGSSNEIVEEGIPFRYLVYENKGVHA